MVEIESPSDNKAAVDHLSAFVAAKFEASGRPCKIPQIRRIRRSPAGRLRRPARWQTDSAIGPLRHRLSAGNSDHHAVPRGRWPHVGTGRARHESGHRADAGGSRQPARRPCRDGASAHRASGFRRGGRQPILAADHRKSGKKIGGRAGARAVVWLARRRQNRPQRSR